MQQTAKLEEVRACIKSGTYVVKVNDSAKKSEAYDLIQIITDKAGNQIHCFYFCTSCANDSKDPIIFADTRNGTSKILAHRRKHDKVVAVSSSAGVGTSKSTQNLGCADDCAKMKDETQQNSTSYMFDADSLSLVLSKMTSIGHDHGVLDPNAVKSLLPQADEWSLDWIDKSANITALINKSYPDVVNIESKTSKTSATKMGYSRNELSKTNANATTTATATETPADNLGTKIGDESGSPPLVEIRKTRTPTKVASQAPTKNASRTPTKNGKNVKPEEKATATAAKEAKGKSVKRAAEPDIISRAVTKNVKPTQKATATAAAAEESKVKSGKRAAEPDIISRAVTKNVKPTQKATATAAEESKVKSGKRAAEPDIISRAVTKNVKPTQKATATATAADEANGKSGKRAAEQGPIPIAKKLRPRN